MEKYLSGSAVKYLKYTIIVLAIIFVILCIFLVRSYLNIRHDNIILARQQALTGFEQKHGPLTSNEVGVIRPWMTFAYVNKLFGLPASYFPGELHMNDSNYPNDTLGDYAASQGITGSVFMQLVQSSIQNYFKTQSP